MIRKVDGYNSMVACHWNVSPGVGNHAFDHVNDLGTLELPEILQSID